MRVQSGESYYAFPSTAPVWKPAWGALEEASACRPSTRRHSGGDRPKVGCPHPEPGAGLYGSGGTAQHLPQTRSSSRRGGTLCCEPNKLLETSLSSPRGTQ